MNKPEPSTALTTYQRAISELTAAAWALEALSARAVENPRSAAEMIGTLVKLEGELCAAAHRLVAAEKEYCLETCARRGLVNGPVTKQ